MELHFLSFSHTGTIWFSSIMEEASLYRCIMLPATIVLSDTAGKKMGEREREREERERESMRCHSCREEYGQADAGTCKECYEEASETEEELKREIEDLKARVSFLRLSSPLDHHLLKSSADLLLHASSDSGDGTALTPAVPAHRAVLISKSPVFKAMLENEMEESRSGMIKIYDASYDVLRSFVQFLYTADVHLDEQMAYDLLVLAEKYQVKHLKAFCEKFMTPKVSNENAIASYVFAHRYNAKQLLEAALSFIMDNMSTLTEREEYKELVEKDPKLVVEIYENYLTRQVNTAAILPKE